MHIVPENMLENRPLCLHTGRQIDGLSMFEFSFYLYWPSPLLTQKKAPAMAIRFWSKCNLYTI